MRLPECACVPGGVSVAGGARLWHAFTPPGFVIMRLVSRSTNLMITARRLTSVRVAGAGEVHEDRVQRACCADEQVVALRAAEGEVGHDLGNVELSESVPSGSKQCSPSAAAAQMRPLASRRMPSKLPAPQVAKTSPPVSVESSVTWKVRIC